MKKLSLAAMGAVMALGANAQGYQCDPSNNPIIEKNVSEVGYIVLSDHAVASFEAKGAKLQYIGPDGASAPRPLYYWAGIAPGDDSQPRVDFDEGGYISLKVLGNAGWSGGGIAVVEPLDLSMINDETRFHMAYMTPTENAPESVCFILLDKPELGSTPGKFAIGANYNDNGTIIPTMGAITSEWQGIDFSVNDLRKLWPAFNPNHLEAWEGNLLSFLAGNVKDTSFAIDACYFYNVDESGIADTVADNAGLVVGNRTVSAPAGGIELFDMAGRMIRSTKGTVLGLDGLASGVYMVRSGKNVEKITVR